MPRIGKKIAFAILIGAWLMLPSFSNASFEERMHQSFGHIGSALGASVDTTINAVGSTYQAAGRQIERQHSMLRRNLRQQISGIHRMLSATQSQITKTHQAVWEQLASVQTSASDTITNAPNQVLSLVAPIRKEAQQFFFKHNHRPL